MFGNFGIIQAPLNEIVGQDADAIVTKTITDESLIAQGKLTGYSTVNKFGNNPTIDIGTVPEDVWGNGGTYTGFIAVAGTVSVVSNSPSDAAAGIGARTVTITGLDSSYNVAQETLTLNGVTPVAGAISFIRVNSATVITAGSNGTNVGVLTFFLTSNPPSIFATMTVGRNQTYTSAYTVPAGYTAYMKNLSVYVGVLVNSSIEGYIWTNTFGGVYRAIRPFSASTTTRYTDQIYAGLSFAEKSDIVIRITTVTQNSTAVNAAYDLILVKN